MSLDSITPILPVSVSHTSAVKQVELGTRVKVDNVDYIYVYNGGAATISQGYGCFLSPANLSSLMTVSVSNAASQSGAERFVGVAHNADIPASEYGFVAVRGAVIAKPDASEISLNSGRKLVPGVDGGFVAFAQSVDTAVTGVMDFVGYTISSFVTVPTVKTAIIKSPLFS